jgi:hypothetical protein
VARQFFTSTAEGITVELGQLRAGSGSWWAMGRRYTELGVEHILGGLDHLMFVAGLLLLVSQTLPLIKTITAFTLAHSVTLEHLAAMTEDERLECLLPVDALLPGHLAVELGPEDASRFLSGVRRRGPWVNCERVAVYGTEPRALLGTGHVAGGELIPGRLLSPIEITQTLAAH